MPATTEGSAGDAIRRLAWFVGLWAASVATLGVVALALRSVLHP